MIGACHWGGMTYRRQRCGGVCLTMHKASMLEVTKAQMMKHHRIPLKLATAAIAHAIKRLIDLLIDEL